MKITDKQQVFIKSNKQLKKFCDAIKFDLVSIKAPCYYTENRHGRGFSTESKKSLETIPASKFLKPSLKKRVKELEKEIAKVHLKIDLHDLFPKTKPSSDIEVHFNEVEKPLGFETGKWYKYPDTSFLMCVRNYDHEDKSASGYGINSTGEWFDSVIDVEGLIPATDEEVKEALIKEAERRGFKEGVRFISPGGTDYGYRLEENARITYDLSRDTLLWTPHGNIDGTGKHLYSKGKWAEIISEPEAIDFSKAGQLVISKSDKVVVYTSADKPKTKGSFCGAVVEQTKYCDKGYYSNDWDSEQFELFHGKVTLSN